MRTALLIILAVGLTACSSFDRRSGVVTVCPAAQPQTYCDPWPDGGHRPADIDELQDAYLRGEAAHADCRAAVEAWQHEYNVCIVATR